MHALDIQPNTLTELSNT